MYDDFIQEIYQYYQGKKPIKLCRPDSIRQWLETLK